MGLTAPSFETYAYAIAHIIEHDRRTNRMVLLSTRQENQLYFDEGNLKRSC